MHQYIPTPAQSNQGGGSTASGQCRQRAQILQRCNLCVQGTQHSAPQVSALPCFSRLKTREGDCDDAQALPCAGAGATQVVLPFPTSTQSPLLMHSCSRVLYHTESGWPLHSSLQACAATKVSFPDLTTGLEEVTERWRWLRSSKPGKVSVWTAKGRVSVFATLRFVCCQHGTLCSPATVGLGCCFTHWA